MDHVASWWDADATMQAAGNPLRLNPELMVIAFYEHRKVVEEATNPVLLGEKGLEKDPFRDCPACAHLPDPPIEAGALRCRQPVSWLALPVWCLNV